MLSISRNVHMFVCLSVCLCVHFAPTSRSRMSNIFRDSESLGKINGKKWSQVLKLVLIKGVKLQRKKRFVFGEFCLTSRIFFGIGATIGIV